MKIQHEPYAGTQTSVFLIKNLVIYSDLCRHANKDAVLQVEKSH